MKNKELYGTILALLTAVVSGVAIPLNKFFVVGIDPTVFTAIRALFIGLVFLIIAGVQCKFDLKAFKKVSWSILFLIGIIGGGMAFLLFFHGLKLTTAIRGAFLHKTLPLFVAVLAYFILKEKITKKQWYALLAMFTGTILIFYTKIPISTFWANPQLGDILIIMATMLWAVENIFARSAMLKGETNFVVTFARMFFGALFLFAFVLVLGKFDVLLNLTYLQIRNLLISTGMLTLYVLFWYWSIKLINVSKAVMILLLAPVISLVIGAFFFYEPTPPLQLLGSALILAGAYFVVKIKSEFFTGV